MINMKYQASFATNNRRKTSNCRLLQIRGSALIVKVKSSDYSFLFPVNIATFSADHLACESFQEVIGQCNIGKQCTVLDGIPACL